MQIGSVHTAMVGPHTTESAGQGSVTRTSALNSEGLSHDGATTGEDLEIGHAARAGRDMVSCSGGGERSEGGG